MSFAIIMILVAFVLIMILMQPSRVIYIRLLSVPVLCILFILCLILLSETVVKSALSGLQLWAGVVVPSLFPFFIAAEVMNSTGFIRASGLLLEPLMRPLFNVPGCGSFPLAMGVTSGYPVGAKITCDFRRNGNLTKTEAERLLAFTNNSGPLFIVGAVGTGMYGSPRIGIFLFFCHLFACITVGFLFRFYKYNKRPCRVESTSIKSSIKPLRAFKSKLVDDHNSNKFNFGTVLGDAVGNSVSTILAIGGFIVLFSVIIHLLSEIGAIGALTDVFAILLSPLGVDTIIIKGVLSGLFEITTGSGMISAALGIPIYQQLPAASFIIGWAGLSVHFQVLSIASKTDISIRPYLVGKLLQGIISAVYTWFGLKLFYFDLLIHEPVLGNIPLNPATWMHSLGTTVSLLLSVLAVFIVLGMAGRLRAAFLKQRQ